MLTAKPPTKETGDCVGTWMAPTCSTPDICTYVAQWSLNETTDDITFNIVAQQDENKWTGIGIAPQPFMVHLQLIHVKESYVNVKNLFLSMCC